MAAEGEFRGTINTVAVADIDAVVAKALANGGSIAMEKHSIPGVGFQAYIKDSTGILVGLHQADERAGM
jgi:predicted enzyme related to lactoylglutathione lyase